MDAALRWRSADLETFPDNGKRYEIIEGELHVSKQPHWHHQQTCNRIQFVLTLWNDTARLGWVAPTPGLIFSDDEDVVPDIIWVSHARASAALADDGKLHAAPELVVEVMSPGSVNERRDREAKLKLYSRRGVREYWIVDWRARQVEVYRREGIALALVGTLLEGDSLTSPLLPGFTCPVATLFEDIPRSN